jgi:hypothetical protein
MLTARVDDPIQGPTLATCSTIVNVEHFPDDSPPRVVEMALELAPDVEDWSRY